MTDICENHVDCTIVSIAPVGDVHFANSKRAKQLSITVRHDSSIKVAIPKGMTLSAAEKFFQTKIPWVKKNLNKIRRMQIQRRNRQDQPLLELSAGEKRNAKKHLIQRLDYLADKYGFT